MRKIVVKQFYLILCCVLFSLTVNAQVERVVTVLTYENKGSSDVSWMGKGIEAVLSQKLKTVSKFRVFESETIDRVLRKKNIKTRKDLQPKQAFAIGKETGVEIIYTGSYLVSGDNITLDFILISTYTGVAIYEKQFVGKKADIFDLLTQGIERTLYTMELTISPDETAKLRKNETRSMAAFEFFGKAYEEIGKNAPIEVATSLFQRASAEDPGFISAVFNSGVLFYNQRQYDKAELAFDGIVNRAPNDERGYFGKGVLAFLQNDHLKAIRFFRKTLQINPTSDRAFYYLGMSQVRSDSLKAGIQSLDKSIDINPDFAAAHYQLGLAEMQRGWFKQAITSLSNATRLDDKLYRANNALGESYYSINFFEEAILEFNKAIKLKPNYATAYFNLGNAIYRRGALAEIVDAFWSIIEVNYDKSPTNNQPIGDLGKLRKKSKEVGDQATITKDMIGAYRKALENDKRFYEASYNLALTYENLAKEDSAVFFYKLAIEQQPDLSQANMRLAKIYESQKKYDIALEYYKTVVRNDPDYFASNPKLSEAYRYKNVVEEVLLENVDLLNKNPNNEEALEIVGKIYLSLGRLGQAAEYYQKLVSVNPNDSIAKKTLRQIKRKMQKM